jgi:hypothetical protein
MKQITKFNFSKLFTLAVFVLVLFAGGQQAKAEIPNGDGDLLWERGLNGRTVNDAVFHPINGNIIAAVNHEIWEIDPKDGHTIRVFEGGSASGEYDQFEGIKITSDGKYVVSDGGSGIEGLLIWDYETGKIKQVFDKGGPNRGSLGIYPDNQRVIFFTFQLTGSENRELVQYNIGTNQIEKKVSVFPYGIEKLSLSKDGKYLAIGKTQNNNGHWKYSMELWDAETLTPIKGFGSPGDNVHEFTDVQISNDDQYFAFATDFNFFIYKFSGELVFTTTFPIYLHESQFTNDSKMILIRPFNSVTKRKAFTYFFNLTIMDSVYKYNESYGTFRFNSNNELFVQGYDSLIGVKIQLFSNHWYTVGVNESAGTTFKIEQVNYTKNNLQIITNGIDIIDDLIITDTLGKRLYQKNKIAIINNQAEIPVFLQSGNYLIKIKANSKELTGKFIVVR